MPLSLLSHSESQTIALGEALGRLLQPGDVIALHGDLGAGKTRLVRGLARGAGADSARVSSPTFVIMQEYACAGPTLRTLVHIDAYRLRGADELETIGWERLARELADRAPVAAVVEWAERIENALPPHRIDMELAPGPDATTRRITITDDALSARPGWADIAALAAAARPATRCPITGKTVPSDSPTYPFFDERARMADLGKWLTGSYSVSRDLAPDDSDPEIREQ